jgi:hypothetical protein
MLDSTLVHSVVKVVKVVKNVEFAKAYERTGQMDAPQGCEMP